MGKKIIDGIFKKEGNVFSPKIILNKEKLLELTNEKFVTKIDHELFSFEFTHPKDFVGEVFSVDYSDDNHPDPYYKNEQIYVCLGGRGQSSIYVFDTLSEKHQVHYINNEFYKNVVEPFMQKVVGGYK